MVAEVVFSVALFLFIYLFFGGGSVVFLSLAFPCCRAVKKLIPETKKKVTRVAK